MNLESKANRRSFLGGMAGVVAAAMEGGQDDWIKEVKGTHKCLFDFPQHKNFFPLLHVLNYIDTYAKAYKVDPTQVGTVGTFYSVGSQARLRACRSAPVSTACTFGCWSAAEVSIETIRACATGLRRMAP